MCAASSRSSRATDVGNRTRVTVKKNKVAPPFSTAEFDIMYNEGITTAGDLIDLGVAEEVITKRGAFFSYGDLRLGQGRENAKTFLVANPNIAVKSTPWCGTASGCRSCWRPKWATASPHFVATRRRNGRACPGHGIKHFCRKARRKGEQNPFPPFVPSRLSCGVHCYSFFFICRPQKTPLPILLV